MLIGTYQPFNPGSTGQIITFGQQAGFTPRITSYYTTAFTQPFATQFSNEMAEQGTMVLVQWQPRGTTNAAIAAGQEDTAIIAAAEAIGSVNSQVIVSYGQEMNGNWYPWADVAPNTAAEYIAAYQHIWTIFQKQNVHNVTWLWGPNISYSGSAPLKEWYPGDQYVDWVGMDGYFGYATDTFESVFGPTIAEIRAFTYKPMIISETGVTGASGPTQIASIFQGAALNGFVAIVYFDETQSGDAMHQDWRLENNAANMAAFAYQLQFYAQRPLIISQLIL